MRKRVAVVVLWAFAGWTLGSFLAFSIGAPEAIGPILAAAAGALPLVASRLASEKRRPLPAEGRPT